MIRNMDALLRFIEERQAVPFAWPQPFDCVSFAMGAVEAQCGWTPLRRQNGRRMTWRSRRGALRVVAGLGGLEVALDARMTSVAPAKARRGDVAGVADDLLGVRLMVVEGETLVSPGMRGLKRVPRSQMIRAWSAEQPSV